MYIVALLIGIILIVAAIRNTYGQLFSALGQDVPSFMVWAAAIFAVGALGFIPGLKGPSRLLIGLVLVVIVLGNYQKVLVGFGNAGKVTSGGSPDGTADKGEGEPKAGNANAALSILSDQFRSQMTGSLDGSISL